MAGRKNRTVWNFIDRMEGDKVVWIIALMLILISIVCIFSSTSRLLGSGQTRVDMVRSQLMTVGAGLGIIILCYNIRSIRFFRVLSRFGFLFSLILLLILVTHLDLGFIKAASVNGAYRILKVREIQIHVFEIVKVAMVMYLSWALDAFKKGELKWPGEARRQKILYVYIPFLTIILFVLPGSFGSALLIGGIMFITILLGGGNTREMGALLGASLIVLLGCWGIYEISGHKAMSRIGTAISRLSDKDHETVFLTSGSRKERQDALDLLRQPYGARIAVHEGGLLGKGPGQSTQRYFVPDMSEDYMYSFIVEEYGLAGGILVIFLYVSLLARGSIIVRNSKNDDYAKLTVAGLCLLITGQAFLHLFVNVGIGPMTGQTLPLISHGRSAFLCFSMAFGIILSFSRIAARKIAVEQKNAAPILDMQAETRGTTAGEDDNDEGNGKMETEIYDYAIPETSGDH